MSSWLKIIDELFSIYKHTASRSMNEVTPGVKTLEVVALQRNTVNFLVDALYIIKPPIMKTFLDIVLIGCVQGSGCCQQQMPSTNETAVL